MADVEGISGFTTYQAVESCIMFAIVFKGTIGGADSTSLCTNEHCFLFQISHNKNYFFREKNRLYFRLFTDYQ